MIKSYYVLARSKEGLRDGTAVFVRDGFSFKAFLFNILWLFYHRMWLVGIVISVICIVAAVSVNQGFISSETALILQIYTFLVVGNFSSDWFLCSREENGYQLVDIIVADGIKEAKLRFFDQNC